MKFEFRFPNIVSLGLFALLQTGYARDYHLSNSGDNSADGSKTNPMQTLSRISELKLQPGDRVLLRSGQTFEGPLLLTAEDAGTAREPVSIMTWPPSADGRATINAGDGSGVLVADAAGIVICDLEIVGSGPASNFGSGVRFLNKLPDATRLNFVRIQRVKAHGFAGRTDRLKNVWQGKTYRVAEEGHGIGFGLGLTPDSSTSGYGDVLIEDCEVFENQHTGVIFEQPQSNPAHAYSNYDITLRRVKAHHNHGDSKFLDNHSGSGIFLNFTDQALIENCEAWENGGLCKSQIGGPVGIWIHASRNVIIRNCHSHHNRSQGKDGGGFDFDAGVSDSIIESCLAHDNAGAGLLVYSYPESPLQMSRNIARHNVFENNSLVADHGEICISSHGGIWDSSDSLTVENNIIFTNGKNPKSCAFKLGDSPSVPISGISIKNNVIVSRSGAPHVIGHPGKNLRWQENKWFATDPIQAPPYRYGSNSVFTAEEWKLSIEVDRK